MLHELHIFGPLPAAVVEEALRGLSAEPIYDDSGRFDRFRNRPTQGLRSLHPDGVQPSYPPDSVQNRPLAGVRSGSPDSMPIRRPDDARCGQPDNAERWPADGVQRYPSGCVQNHSPAGVGSGSPDSMPIRRPDDARSGWLDSAERWPADGVQRYPSDGVQNRPPAGVGRGSLDSMPIRRPDDARRGQPDSAERWPAEDVQGGRLDCAGRAFLDSTPSCLPDSAQNRPPAGAGSGSPDNMPIRRPDDARSGRLDSAERWPADGVQGYPSDSVQNRPPAGVGSGSPDNMPIRRPDDARSGWLDGAERWPADGVQRYPSDSVQNHSPAGVGSGSPDSMPIRRTDNVRSGRLESAKRWPADGVQSWRIRGLGGAEERRRLLGALLFPVREARATVLLRAVGSEIRGAAFDLEGTLTELEFVDALAGRLGFGERMQVRTRASMTGRTLDFRRDYEDRMAALRGVEVAVMEEVIGSVTLAAGVDALCERLHAAAIPVAVISGGCSRLGEAVRKKIAARALYATVWEEHAARFTGHAASPVVDPAGKFRALEDFARTTACPLGNMAAAGDGANDLEMLSAAGTALLTHATARPAWPEILAALL